MREEPLAKAKPFDIPKRMVWEAYQRMKANRGAAGVDDQSIEAFDQDVKNNLFKVWNRLSSGSYFPPPVKRVAIKKRDGGSRPLGVLEVFATKRRDRRAALKFLKRTMKRYGRPRSIVTDRLRSYRAAMKTIGIAKRQECGRWLNNRAENSHQPFRRREGAMARFRDIKTLQKFAAAHASIHNHFNQDRHLNRRDIFKQNRAAALAEWRQLPV